MANTVDIGHMQRFFSVSSIGLYCLFAFFSVHMLRINKLNKISYLLVKSSNCSSIINSMQNVHNGKCRPLFIELLAVIKKIRNKILLFFIFLFTAIQNFIQTVKLSPAKPFLLSVRNT